ncbi:7240_t:CDS:2 [Funneliformis caledonium]|uniref:7240_t:CDS:1 n=1 Tax=Funneliformis caledonium TaxID=1117310 RepID=A0A9N9B7W0_9GLOM|nr:7240_t:CDS:2 [Funneliformis caledonium]
MSSFLTNFSFSKKEDNKFDISSIFISFITVCALSTFCGLIFVVNFTGWFVISFIGGTITKGRQELFNYLSGKSWKKNNLDNMLDHRLNSRHLGHFEEFHSSSLDSLPSMPSYRSTPKSNKSIINSNKFDSLLSLDFSFIGLTGDSKSNKPQKNLKVLPPSEYSQKRNEKRTKSMKERHTPEVPSQLGPNRPKEWKSAVDYYPSERHSHQPKSKSKLSVTDKMIESTAAYRVGKKCNGWINGDAEEYAIKKQQQQMDSMMDCTNFNSYDDPFYSNEPIKDLNVRLDQERPKITKKNRRNSLKSPSSSLQHARQYLTILLKIKRGMNL